ncbi:MAG: tetratricopeptide repeat protein [Methyloceanibacter sp.]
MSFAAILAVVLAVVAVAPAHAEDQVLLRAREGAAAMIRGQFDKAVALYDEALATPDVSKFVQAGIYSDRGIAKWRMQKTKAAIADFNQAIELSPENATVYNNRGNALMDLGHPEEALKDFDRAIALRSTYGAAYNNRGNAYAALHKYGAAFQSFRKAAQFMPQSAIPFNGRGRSQTELTRYHAAVRDLTRAISLNPRYAEAYRNRAEANFAIGNYRDAEHAGEERSAHADALDQVRHVATEIVREVFAPFDFGVLDLVGGASPPPRDQRSAGIGATLHFRRTRTRRRACPYPAAALVKVQSRCSPVLLPIPRSAWEPAFHLFKAKTVCLAVV